MKKLTIIFIIFLFEYQAFAQPVKTGAQLTEKYIPLLKGQKIAIVANHTSMIDKTHLVDSLINLDINIIKIFSPEHGFRGKAAPGEKIQSGTDEKTGIPVISLYGKKKKPHIKELMDVDWVVFDIQDVGVRFYTYISTMHYVMEACAQTNTKFMVLDRPNPNGFYIDGPVLKNQFKSFVGMHPIPVVHGLTIGELASMIVGESWIDNANKLHMTVIPCENYDHTVRYQLPVKPSPNLMNMQSVYLYPSLALFEGTVVSIGRGTDFPFQVYGHPGFPDTLFSFTPSSNEGSKHPKHQNVTCYGYDLREEQVLNSFFQYPEINLHYLFNAWSLYNNSEEFFNSFFLMLEGSGYLKDQIKNGLYPEEIKLSWQDDLKKYRNMRKKYLLYKDF